MKTGILENALDTSYKGLGLERSSVAAGVLGARPRYDPN